MYELFPAHAQAVVIGGGVIGISTAYHLAEQGWSDVIVLERDKLTSGTTWHAAGLIASAGMATETLSWISRYSCDLYQRLDLETGVSTGFHQCGHLHIATTKTRREAQRREMNFMRLMGHQKHEIWFCCVFDANLSFSMVQVSRAVPLFARQEL